MDQMSGQQEYAGGKKSLVNAFSEYKEGKPGAEDILYGCLLTYANVYMRHQKFRWSLDREDVAADAVEKMWQIIQKRAEEIETVSGYFSIGGRVLSKVTWQVVPGMNGVCATSSIVFWTFSISATVSARTSTEKLQ